MAHPSVWDVPENNVVTVIDDCFRSPHREIELVGQILELDTVEEPPGYYGSVALRVPSENPLIDRILDLVPLDLTVFVLLHPKPPR